MIWGLLLLFSSIGALLYGISVWLAAETIMQQIAALLAFLISAVLFTGLTLLCELSQIKKKLAERQDTKARDNNQ
jgi:hypothetical protein